MVKKAFTMIEMIFAIVLIGIIVAAVPEILTRNAQTVEGNRAQEAVFLASAAANRLMSYNWDSNSKDTNLTVSSNLDYAKVLDVNQSPAASERQSVSVGTATVSLPIRNGHIPQDKHRRFHSVYTPPATASPLGIAITLNDTTLGADAFKFGYALNITGGYASAFGATTTSGTVSNIKMAIIDIDNTTTGVTDVKMRIYAFNIGEIDYAKRTFQ